MKERLCRFCGAPLNYTFVDLGLSPLANSYIRPEQRDEGERFYPLHAYVCDRCFLVQLEEIARPEQIFSDYAYFSGFSSTWLRHCETYVTNIVERFALTAAHKVVEVASNDGYLLQYFVAKGIPVLGVEPARNVAEHAIGRGVPTEVLFFGRDAALKLRQAGHMADLMVANNVLAHVPDILDFIEGFRVLLKPQGIATFEFPHLLRIVGQTQFDTIYHEHFSYLSLNVVDEMLRANGLSIFDVEELATHGGSLRVYVCQAASAHERTAAVDRILEVEQQSGLRDLSTFAQFSGRVVDIKCALLSFLIEARRLRKIVCAYGAAAKGNTLLNYCGIGPEFVQVVADRSPHKQNTCLPGSRIPVVSPEAMLARRPHYVLILPWNLREEIAAEVLAIRSWGGACVTAIPRLVVD